ncbi:hypothetical protein DUNSADRAFT_14669 [Dunaliella salina]|uniref:Tubulin/FtsZ GTPase domain-containing protein n=1 Tax=Dunaliella salina TaxID=3046 RepID=A0ABQ7G708_DUNSA|nr:hypothetical protein DUNSADRAFT_14669 [Dunaliella salina]|eukprot:KAF5830372.1 hypothetical protein DUNSADRAFT_14669 [Dunaliella salina]
MSSRVPRWNSSTAVEDPNMQEAHLLDHLQEGIRKECEDVDGAPDFLMLHSLGGGSGSGLGSRLLECLREEYPLNYIATVSVAPRPAGDSPMQSLNSTMALSFLQAYADIVMVFDNQAMLEAAVKSQKTANMADVNYHIALSALGALWPMSPGEPYSGAGRIRDMATTVAADSCLKLVEARTSAVPTGSNIKGLWRDASLAVARLFPRFDVLDANNPIVTSSALLLARGFPAETLQPSPPPQSLLPTQSKLSRAAISSAANASDVCGVVDHGSGLGTRQHVGRGAATREVPLSAEAAATAASTFVQACHGAASFACPPDAVNSIWPRHGPCKLSLAQANTAGEASKRKSAIAGVKNTASEGGNMAVTAVANRSSAIGLLSRIGDKARLMSQSGAYLHWFERYGCSKAALDDALETVDNMADSYRLAHGIRDFL